MPEPCHDTDNENNKYIREPTLIVLIPLSKISLFVCLGILGQHQIDKSVTIISRTMSFQLYSYSSFGLLDNLASSTSQMTPDEWFLEASADRRTTQIGHASSQPAPCQSCGLPNSSFISPPEVIPDEWFSEAAIAASRQETDVEVGNGALASNWPCWASCQDMWRQDNNIRAHFMVNHQLGCACIDPGPSGLSTLGYLPGSLTDPGSLSECQQ